MQKIKLGLVGIGKIARDQHLPVLSESSDFELVAVASRNATVEGVRRYRSLTQMLDERPDIEAVSLCTPPGPRETDARIALERDVHVLLEKPPAATLGAAHELISLARRAVINASWHSRHAAGVSMAQEWLRSRSVHGVEINWKEDVRIWHPGQEWIWDVGGPGVFDPGINALSILTFLIADPIVLCSAELGVPAGRHAPLTAELALRTSSGIPIKANFDFLQTGEQTWDIRISAEDGVLLLRDGGARLSIDGADQLVHNSPRHEYASVYRHFAECIRTGISDCDLRPLQIVADACMLGQRTSLRAFAFDRP